MQHTGGRVRKVAGIWRKDSWWPRLGHGEGEDGGSDLWIPEESMAESPRRHHPKLHTRNPALPPHFYLGDSALSTAGHIRCWARHSTAASWPPHRGLEEAPAQRPPQVCLWLFRQRRRKFSLRAAAWLGTGWGAAAGLGLETALPLLRRHHTRAGAHSSTFLVSQVHSPAVTRALPGQVPTPLSPRGLGWPRGRPQTDSLDRPRT